MDIQKENAFLNTNINLNISKRNLPHWEQGSVWYSVTFRLYDSLPQEKLKEYAYQRDLWLKQNNNNIELKRPKKNEYYKLFSDMVDLWLNSGYGKCILKQYEISKILDDSIKYFNGDRYILDSWVIMPNHVHILFKPVNDYTAQNIVASWKSYTANTINRQIGSKGQLWAHESYDHIVRSVEEFLHIRNYIANNPQKADIEVSHMTIGEG